MPLRENASLARRFWRIPDNVPAAQFRILASASDQINMTAAVMAVDVKQDWVIDATSSTSASYDFSGLSLIGWDITHNVSGITINSATLNNCSVILNGGALNACNISKLKSQVLTNDPEKITNCDFTSDGTGYAIEITATGTFDFTGNTFTGYGADSSADAAIYNNSGGAVTLSLPTGAQVPTITNGAGASTTITAPAITYTLEVPNIINGSRYQIYNVTADVELANTTVSAGSGISEVFTKDVDYTAGDVGRYRITEQSGTTAKNEVEGSFVFGALTTVNSLPLTQTDNTVYNTYGVNGSTISEFSWDSGYVQIDIDDSNNATTIQRFAAWYSYFITTATGIDEAFGAFVWENVNSVKIISSLVDLTIDNIKSAPLLITGGRLYRDDGDVIIASTSNSIQIDYEPVYVVEVSGGGGGSLTAEDVWDYSSRTLTSQGNTDIADAIQPELDAIKKNTNLIPAVV